MHRNDLLPEWNCLWHYLLLIRPVMQFLSIWRLQMLRFWRLVLRHRHWRHYLLLFRPELYFLRGGQ
jgi:hypothetical protein